MRNGLDYTRFLEKADQLRTRVDEPIKESEVITPEDMEAEVLALYETGYRPGLRTGWPSLDPFYSVRHGEFTVITGIPGHGKSSWLDNLMVNMSRMHGWKWAVFSAENLPVARHVAGLLEIYTGLPFRRGPSQRMGRETVRDILQWMREHFHFIRPKEDRYSLDRIVQIAFSFPDIDALVIDPWNELDASRPRDMREDEFISVSLSKLRWLARNAEIHVFVVAHPGKYHREPGKQKPVITLNDIKGASEWYAKADNGLSVWRDEQDQSGASDVHVQKIRFREVGRAGEAVRLYYDRVTGRFSDPTATHLREPGEDDE